MGWTPPRYPPPRHPEPTWTPLHPPQPGSLPRQWGHRENFAVFCHVLKLEFASGRKESTPFVQLFWKNQKSLSKNRISFPLWGPATFDQILDPLLEKPRGQHVTCRARARRASSRGHTTHHVTCCCGVVVGGARGRPNHVTCCCSG